MRLATVSAFFLTIAVLLVISVACQIFIKDFVRPHTVYLALIAGTVLSAAVSLLIDTDISVAPN